ncbi:vWA domain-containing protein [Hoeflea sp.]|uniref:vWA domain-containing protein n=1 Tax=Hoeflea sp. TaxID=1940281 RepID=UPI003B5252E5
MNFRRQHFRLSPTIISFHAIAIVLLFLSAGARAESQSNVMFVLDGSNSMWGQIDGTAKISIAKDVMTELITDWDETVPMGLMVYGHRRRGDCQDIETVALPGQATKQTLIGKVQSITPRGKTPISLSLLTAKAELLLHNLGKFPGPKTSLVLVSDGLETCNADPCASALEWEVADPGTDVHVIGFDVTDEESRALQCISRNTGGKFFRANNADELQAALKETVKIASGGSPAPTADVADAQPAEPQASQFLYAKLCEACERLNPLDVSWNVYKDGQPFYTGLGVIFPDDPVFEAGNYEVAVRYKSSQVTATGEIEFGEDGEQIGALDLNGGSAVMFAYATDDKTMAAEPIFYQFYPITEGEPASEPLTENASSNSATWLPAGLYRVVASHDQVKESAEIEIIAGEETRHDFDMRVGYFEPAAVLTPGSKPLGGFMDFFVYATQDAARKTSALDSIVSLINANGDRQPLKPGRYFVRASVSYNRGTVGFSRIFPFEIRANEVTAPVFDMNGGLLSHAVKSESGKSITNIDYVGADDGKRVEYFNAGGSNTAAFPVGRYYLRILSGGETYESDQFEILPGKTTTVNVTIP